MNRVWWAGFWAGFGRAQIWFSFFVGTGVLLIGMPPMFNVITLYLFWLMGSLIYATDAAADAVREWRERE